MYNTIIIVADNECKGSLSICHMSRLSFPISRILSVPIYPTCAEQGRSYDSNKQTNKSPLQTGMPTMTISVSSGSRNTCIGQNITKNDDMAGVKIKKKYMKPIKYYK